MSNIIPLSKLRQSSEAGPLSILPVFSDEQTIKGKINVGSISKLLQCKNKNITGTIIDSVEDVTNNKTIKNFSFSIDNTIYVRRDSKYNTWLNITSNDEQLRTCQILTSNKKLITLAYSAFINGFNATQGTDYFYILLNNYSNITVTFMGGGATIKEIDLFGDEFTSLNFENTPIQSDCLSLLNCPNIKNINGTISSNSYIKKILTCSGVYTNVTSFPLT